MPDYNEVRKALASENAIARIEEALVVLAVYTAKNKVDAGKLSWPAIGDLNHVANQLGGIVSFWSRGRELER